MQNADTLPVSRAADLPPSTTAHAWLVRDLWSEQAVGIIGGAPKACKTWLALDLAVSVAAGSDALGFFPASQGPVLLYGAEDPPHCLLDRLKAICHARHLALDNMPLWLITAPSLSLDSPKDLGRLKATLSQLRPRLLVLDPLVRLHRGDENSAGDMAVLLGSLRNLQRQFHLAIILVHHLRKNATSTLGGRALRGSGDLHAWGDSNLYLSRNGGRIRLVVEQRAAASAGPFSMQLDCLPSPHLELVQEEAAEESMASSLELADRILAALDAGPKSRDMLRDILHVRNASLGRGLAGLMSQGVVVRQENLFALKNGQIPIPVPTTTHAPERERESLVVKRA